MRNKKHNLLVILFALGIVICALTFILATETTPPQPTTQAETESTYEITEVLEVSCTTHDDCELPFDYAIRSNCPYQSLCLQNKCTVVCPYFNGEVYIDPTVETIELEAGSLEVQ